MALVRGWLTRLTARRRAARRADVRALLSLDDRMLADIGLRRTEVAVVASGQLPLDQLTLEGPIGPNDRRPPPLEAAPDLTPAPDLPPAPEHWDEAA